MFGKKGGAIGLVSALEKDKAARTDKGGIGNLRCGVLLETRMDMEYAIRP
jgi:hypothetical protein